MQILLLVTIKISMTSCGEIEIIEGFNMEIGMIRKILRVLDL